MKKKLVAVMMSVSMLAVAVVGGTLAYFTDNDEATNTFTVGNVDIDLTEPNWDAEGKEEAEDMFPGEAVAKDPTVTNVGANPCFVRISIDWPEEVDLTTRKNYVDGISADWTLYTDGYYYYTPNDETNGNVLIENATTDALFDQIVLSTATQNGIEGNLDIVVKAEAVQAQKPGSWSDVVAMGVADIAAWFTTCMATE